MAPRTVLKCKCWGEFVVYENGKVSFSNIQPETSGDIFILKLLLWYCSEG